MWLKRLVGIMMVLAFIVMNTLTVYGLVVPTKVEKPAVEMSDPSLASEPAAQIAPPKITLSAVPTSIAAGQDSALKWESTGDPKCVATSSVPGPWSGEKTQYGAESTGVLKSEGNFTYTLTCTNAGGSGNATATITVGRATPPAKSIVSTSTPVTPVTGGSGGGGGVVYCSGRTPCYGPKDVAAHGSAGNCWGWNGDRVFNITKLDTAYHTAKSGISSIEVSGVCGKDLAPSLSGNVSAGGQTRNHLQTTKVNSSANTNPYYVGYFDQNK